MAWWTRSSTWFPLTRRRGSHPIWTWLRPWRPCLWSRQAARQRRRTWLWKSWPRTQWQKSRGNMTKNTTPFPNNRIEPLHRRVFLLLSQVETTKIVIIFFLLMSCDTSKYLLKDLLWKQPLQRNPWSKGNNRQGTSNKIGWWHKALLNYLACKLLSTSSWWEWPLTHLPLIPPLQRAWDSKMVMGKNHCT